MFLKGIPLESEQPPQEVVRPAPVSNPAPSAPQRPQPPPASAGEAHLFLPYRNRHMVSPQQLTTADTFLLTLYKCNFGSTADGCEQNKKESLVLSEVGNLRNGVVTKIRSKK